MTETELRDVAAAFRTLLHKAIDLESQVTDTWTTADGSRPRRLMARTAIRQAGIALRKLEAWSEESSMDQLIERAAGTIVSMNREAFEELANL